MCAEECRAACDEGACADIEQRQLECLMVLTAGRCRPAAAVEIEMLGTRAHLS